MSLDSLDLAIGLIVVFLLVSTLCSAVREAIEALLKTRAAYLERAIRELLDDESGRGLAKSLFDHPLLSGMFLGAYAPKPVTNKLRVLANGRGLPSYVPARSFARALLDIAARGSLTDEVSSDPTSAAMTVESIRARLLNIHSVRVRRVLLHALDSSRNDIELARQALEDWFNDSMDRVAGWYKRSTQWVLFVIALAVAVGMNIDSIGLAKYFSHDEAARKAAVTAAETLTKKQTPPTKEDSLEVLHELELPIGWSDAAVPHDRQQWLNRILGWLITAMAAMLGAPFWFDVLNKVMVIRSTVKPREKSPEEFSEDRQAPASRADTASRVVASSPSPAPATSPAPVSTAPSVPVVMMPRDPEEERDCCGDSGASAKDERATADEELPAATGGVAS